MGLFGGCNNGFDNQWIWILIIIALVVCCGNGNIFGGNNNCCCDCCEPEPPCNPCGGFNKSHIVFHRTIWLFQWINH